MFQVEKLLNTMALNPGHPLELLENFLLCVCVCNKVLLKYKGDRESF